MRIALPKGRPLKVVQDVLEKIGITFLFKNDRDYTAKSSDGEFTAKLIKAKAVPQMVALGNFEIGFCGLDVFTETNYDQNILIRDIDVARVELLIAVPECNLNIINNPPKRPILIATEYENIAHHWANNKNLAHIIIQTYGSTEAYPPNDADIILDCVETGRTLQANGLIPIEQIMVSTMYLIANKTLFEKNKDKILSLSNRLSV